VARDHEPITRAARQCAPRGATRVIANDLRPRRGPRRDAGKPPRLSNYDRLPGAYRERRDQRQQRDQLNCRLPTRLAQIGHAPIVTSRPSRL